MCWAVTSRHPARLVAVFQRRRAARRLMPRRVAISVQEHPNSRRPMTAGGLDGGLDVGGEGNHGGEGFDVDRGNAAAVGTDYSTGECDVLIALDDVPAPVS